MTQAAATTHTRFLDKYLEAVLAGTSLIIFLMGIMGRNPLASCGAAICLILVIHRWHGSRQGPLAWGFRWISRRASSTQDVQASASTSPEATLDARLKMPKTASSLVNEMIFQGRYAVLARPEVSKNLSESQRQEVVRVLAEEMSPVKPGRVLLNAPHNGTTTRAPEIGEVGSILIDRCVVSNGEYQEFVAAGGYENAELWAPEIRESLATFVDLTQHPGPKYWRNGKFPPGTADHPVVGVCWYEADAYARWVGKRLPRDAEWLKAAVSPRSSMVSAEQLQRFPWGNAFRDDRANLWSSGKGQTVPVTEYPGGQSAEGVYQLVGNVWEWMDGDLHDAWPDVELIGPSRTFKTIRGGAYDTYLESQSACHVPSADSPLARRSNIGFRCVLDTVEIGLNS